MTRKPLGPFVLAALAAGPGLALAGESATPAPSATARYVVVVGANHSYDPAVADLQYADDDALRFADLLAPHARRVDTLTVLDQATQQRHPNRAGGTRVPTREQLLATLARARADIADERRSGRATELVFVFIGHGGLDAQGHGYVHLADAPFTRADVFAEILASSPADTTHLIVDACNAFSLVAGRGDAGRAEPEVDPFEKFLSGHDLEDYPNAGVLAATTASRETHEWSAIQGGLFSYQVRSALSGAADVNGDGLLEYSEVAAFVAAANSDVPEDAKRLSVFAWPPLRDRHAALLDLRSGGRPHRVVLGEAVSGHLVVETDAGARWVELNKAAGRTTTLALPSDRSFFLRGDGGEVEIRPGAATTRIAALPPIATTVTARGAVDRALARSLFGVPFDEGFYRGYVAAARNLLPVSPAGPASVASEPTGTPRPFELAAGYRVSRYPLASDHVEHGVAAAVRVPIGSQWLATAELEVGRSSLDPLPAQVGSRGALSLGVGYRVHLATWLRVSTGVQLGYEALALGRGLDNADWAAALGRLRLALEAQITRGLWLEVGPSYSTHVVTVDGDTRLRDRVELLAGVSF